MGKYESIAHTIIDMVEDAIRKANPEVEHHVQKKFEDGSECNTLLHGENYYDLENEVVQVLKENEEDSD